MEGSPFKKVSAAKSCEVAVSNDSCTPQKRMLRSSTTVFNDSPFSTPMQLKLPRCHLISSPSSPANQIKEKLGEAGLTLLKHGTKVSREVFESSGRRLKVGGRAGVGIDNVDLAAATGHDCLVVNAPTANTAAAAEHGIALLAAMARNMA
ncbi:hypothetical protein F3Y22_tig00111128pilonHSYRG00180 [Hibiscus syriacus]|uniref:D-isomer specific 2-hydroxyacid dehydrogenase catalytic domain-containing protein n=1 Tax=Hibiscus syriacus TaxID=106335 RepID=A0A6A2YYA3_HIBSY|nr:hypothetical protein F3Y22_tig00111128pilonHSYRG00180 [Hibiscus syriacus]